MHAIYNFILGLHICYIMTIYYIYKELQIRSPNKHVQQYMSLNDKQEINLVPENKHKNICRTI